MSYKYKCPICNHDYAATDKSLDVCKKHQGWFVTQCQNCHKVSFSSSIGICIKCSTMFTAKFRVSSIEKKRITGRFRTSDG